MKALKILLTTVGIIILVFAMMYLLALTGDPGATPRLPAIRIK
jgi:hypothetical protein